MKIILQFNLLQELLALPGGGGVCVYIEDVKCKQHESVDS